MPAEMVRTKAAERLGTPDRLDQLMPVTPPRAWAALVGGLLVGLCAVVWSVAGTISVTVAGVGMLSRPGGLSIVAAPTPGVVNKIAVRIGDQVKAGQELLQFTPIPDDASAGGNEGDAASSRVVQSPRSGRVVEVRVLDGMEVDAQEPLVVVESVQEPLLAVVYVPAEQGHRLEPGMPVQVTPSTPPRKGPTMLKGTVRQASLLPISREAMMQHLQNAEWTDSVLQQGPAVEVLIDLPQGPATEAFIGGTACRASITVESRRPISLLFPDPAEELGE